MEPLLTPVQVAEILNLSYRSVLRHFENGVIPGKKIGTKWRITPAALASFVASGVDFGHRDTLPPEHAKVA